MFANASPNQNSTANQQFTLQQIAAFVDQDAESALDFAVQRNPSTVYNFIQQNYPGQFPTIKEGGQYSVPLMQSMKVFLLKQYGFLTTAQAQGQFIWALLHSLPDVAELDNWTTPGTPSNTTNLS